MYMQLSMYDYFTVGVAVRLVNGTTEYEGRVEVYYNGQWGTVCDDEWDLNDAEVVCRQLGFGPAIVAKRNGFYEQGSGEIWLDDLNCVGTESNIGHCLHRGWGFHDCRHSEDAGIMCADPSGNLALVCVLSNINIIFTDVVVVRLFTTYTEYEGRVEVYYNGEWGTVCDNGWDLNDAEVVCKELGYGPAIVAKSEAFYGQGSGLIWLENVDCVDTDMSIIHCSHSRWGVNDCSHSEDAGVLCAPSNGNFSFPLSLSMTVNGRD